MFISVIIPAHNEEKYIEKTLRYINKQSLKRDSYEIIVCNDCSNDRTGKISEKYADIVLNLSKQKNIGAVRNNGARVAKGDILVFIDADTLIGRKTLELLVKEIRKGCDFSMPILSSKKEIDLIYVFDYINKLSIKYMPKLAIFPGCCFAITSKAFKSVNCFSEELSINEDNNLFRKLIKKNKRIGFADTKIYTSERKLDKLGMTKFILHIIKSYISLLSRKNKEQYIKIR